MTGNLSGATKFSSFLSPLVDIQRTNSGFYPEGNLQSSVPFTPLDCREGQRHFTAYRFLRTLRRRAARIQRFDS